MNLEPFLPKIRPLYGFQPNTPRITPSRPYPCEPGASEGFLTTPSTYEIVAEQCQNFLSILSKQPFKTQKMPQFNEFIELSLPSVFATILRNLDPASLVRFSRCSKRCRDLVEACSSVKQRRKCDLYQRGHNLARSNLKRMAFSKDGHSVPIYSLRVHSAKNILTSSNTVRGGFDTFTIFVRGR